MARSLLASHTLSLSRLHTMAGIQLTGLASGLDWKNVVDQLMKANTIPVQRLQSEQTRLEQQSTAIGSLKSKLEALQASLTELNSSSLFSQRSVSSSNSQWTVNAAAGTVSMAHTVNVTQLATAARLEGAGNLSSPLRSDGDAAQILIAGMNLAQPVTAGQFTINGARVSIAITDSLQEIFQKISDATGGTVSASYDGTTDRVTLSSASPIVLGSANDSSNFLQAQKLNNNGSGQVSSASRLGAIRLDSPLAAASIAGSLSLDPDNAGSLVVNGVPISYDADTDSLRTILAKINASTAGVNATYDAANDRLVFTNKVTGDLGVSIQDATGNLGSVLGLTGASNLVRGRNAEFTVDGGAPRTAASNVLDENALGIAGLTITATSESSESITISNDAKSARSKIEGFIAKYNEVLAYVDQMTRVSSSGTTVSTGLLYGEHSVKSVGSSLRSEIFNALGGDTGIQRLESLGIDFDGINNQLKIKDSAKLDSVLLGKSEEVAAFFSAPTSGLGARLSKLIDSQIGSSGSLTQGAELKIQRKTKISTQITDLNRRLEQQRASLEARFIQMEKMQALLKNQLQALDNAFPSKSSSGSSK